MTSIHVHTPWRAIDGLLPLLLKKRLQPEIAFQAADLEDLDPAKVAAVSSTLAAHGLKITVHAPFMDLNPGALDPLVAETTRQRLEQTIQAAAALHAHLIVVHPGYDRWRYDRQPQLWLGRASAFFPPLLDLAGRSGVRLALENIFEEAPDTLTALVQTLDHPCFGHCFDIGHWNLFGRAIPLEHWLSALGDKLFHLHLHDNRGRADDHLPVGGGEIDFHPLGAYLKGRHRLPSITLEAHNLKDLKRSLKALPGVLGI